MKRFLLTALICLAHAAWAQDTATNLPPYSAEPRPADGRNLALAVTKLEQGFTPPRPFLIWALGSSYTAKLGSGERHIELLRERFGKDREIVYKRMVGNSVPWQYLRGWARHLVIPDQPDLVQIYTIGKAEDLELLITEIQRHTTADIIVPSIHWRERGQPNWGKSEDAPDEDVAAIRAICRKHGVEFVENRQEWADYLVAHNLPITALLADSVHESPFGADMIIRNIVRHIHHPDQFAYDPSSRERKVEATKLTGGGYSASFTGNRIDLVGRKSTQGGQLRVLIDGKPAGEIDAFFMSYIQPAKGNFQEARSPARDQSPHGATLGANVIPQTWTITMLDDNANFELSGSVTGPDGRGNALQPFTGTSGQIRLDPAEWRRPERNKAGDTFTWDVRRASVEAVDFNGNDGELFRVTLAANLANAQHTIRLEPSGKGETPMVFLEAFEPPMK